MQPITRTPYDYNRLTRAFEIKLSNGEVVSHPDSIACVVKAAEARLAVLNRRRHLPILRASVVYGGWRGPLAAKVAYLRRAATEDWGTRYTHAWTMLRARRNARVLALLVLIATLTTPEPTPPAISASTPKKSRRSTRVRRQFDGPMSAKDVIADFKLDHQRANSRLKAAA